MQKHMRQEHRFHHFLKGLILGGIALTMSAHLALAQSITVKDIDSAGLPPGMIRMSSNENPMGPSPKAIEAVEKYVHNSNRYGWYELDEKGNPKSLNPGTPDMAFTASLPLFGGPSMTTRPSSSMSLSDR